MESLILSQNQLLSFLTCKRRFQLRYKEKLAWPYAPLDPQQATAIDQGRRFHQLVERYILGLPVVETDIADHQLRLWWHRFKQSVLPLPNGRCLPELALTVPIDRHFLTGRFDLVIIGMEENQPSVLIYDWKTSQPNPVSELRDNWQTKLYLALMAESKSAVSGINGKPIPDQIKLTYWYVDDPQTPREIAYSIEEHKQNWAEIQAVVAEINYCQEKNLYPLTDNWRHCRSCDFGSYCGRIEDGASANILAEERALYDFEPVPFLEPESP